MYYSELDPGRAVILITDIHVKLVSNLKFR